MTDRAAVDRWLDAYVAAWKTYDREARSARCSPRTVEYRYHPDGETRSVGREAVVALVDRGRPRRARARYDGAYEVYRRRR